MDRRREHGLAQEDVDKKETSTKLAFITDKGYSTSARTKYLGEDTDCKVRVLEGDGL
jgi:hypothetical protein